MKTERHRGDPYALVVEHGGAEVLILHTGATAEQALAPIRWAVERGGNLPPHHVFVDLEKLMEDEGAFRWALLNDPILAAFVHTVRNMT